MLQQEFLARVISVLQQCKIEYMVTGSVVSSLQGEPRTSHDIDIVVHIHPTAILSLLQSFPPPKYFLTKESILQAIQHKSVFNLIDTEEGDKIDFWILTDVPFDVSRFSRKKAQKIFNTTIFISQPEDTILMKLYWATKSGGSEKQTTDAIRVFELQYKNLDMKYIERWVDELDIRTLWDLLLQQARPLL